jgi:amino acid permease
MKHPKAYYQAIATLTGCVIGAGILAIPYVILQAGFWTGLFVIIGLGLISLLIHLMIGEVALRTKACYQLSGYADKYLGKWGKMFMAMSMIIGVYGAMVAYTLGAGESLAVIFGGFSWVWMVVFYLVMCMILFGSIRLLEQSELVLGIIKTGIFLLVLGVLFFSQHFSLNRIGGFSLSSVMIPYGVILFAYIGTAAIPEVKEEMASCLRLAKKAIIVGSLIPIAAYALFAFAVIGVSGVLTTEVATLGVGFLTGPAGFLLLHLFAIIAMSTAFISLGFALKDSYWRDFRLPKWESYALVAAIPAVLLIVGVSSFAKTLEIAGTFAGGIAGIVIAVMHYNAKKFGERKPEFSVNVPLWAYIVIISVFVIGMFYQLASLL